MPTFPTLELTFLGCRALHRAAQGIPQPSRGASAPWQSQPLSLLPKDKARKPAPSCFHLCATWLRGTKHLHRASPHPPLGHQHLLLLSSPSPGCHQPTALHPFRGKQEMEAAASPSPLHPGSARQRAYSAAGPAVCLATGTGDGQDEGNFSPFHASF